MENAVKMNNKGKREYGRVPNPVVYGLVYLAVKVFSRLLFHVNWHIDPRIRKLPRPFTVLGNHPSYIDPFLTGGALYPVKVNFLAAANFFRSRKLRSFLYLGGIIPKTQFRADPGAIKSMLKVVKRGGVLGIFPEGARSIDGTSLPVDETITKFIKKTGGAVVIASSCGSYLTWPRWSTSGIRKGKVEFGVNLLFTQEEVAALPVEQLQTGILRALESDEYAWQEKAMVPYRSKAPARGLHDILHQCPACKKRWVMDTTDTSLYCRECGNTAIMDVYGFLNPEDDASVIFKTVRDWNRWQMQDLIPAGTMDSFFLEEEAELFVSEGRDALYQAAGNGTIRIDHTGFVFKGTFQGENVVKSFPLAGILGISSDFGSNFDLVSDHSTSKLFLKNGQKVISFSHALDLFRGNRSYLSENIGTEP